MQREIRSRQSPIPITALFFSLIGDWFWELAFRDHSRRVPIKIYEQHKNEFVRSWFNKREIDFSTFWQNDDSSSYDYLIRKFTTFLESFCVLPKAALNICLSSFSTRRVRFAFLFGTSNKDKSGAKIMKNCIVHDFRHPVLPKLHCWLVFMATECYFEVSLDNSKLQSSAKLWLSCINDGA